jgi:hypothetical protein
MFTSVTTAGSASTFRLCAVRVPASASYTRGYPCQWITSVMSISSPSRNAGIAIPEYDSSVAIRSKGPPRFIAAASPTSAPATVASRIAGTRYASVRGIRSASIARVDSPVWADWPKSNVANDPTHSTYRPNSGSS